MCVLLLPLHSSPGQVTVHICTPSPQIQALRLTIAGYLVFVCMHVCIYYWLTSPVGCWPRRLETSLAHIVLWTKLYISSSGVKWAFKCLFVRRRLGMMVLPCNHWSLLYEFICLALEGRWVWHLISYTSVASFTVFTWFCIARIVCLQTNLLWFWQRFQSVWYWWWTARECDDCCCH